MPSSKFGSKFLGKERYQQYVEELTADGTIGGEQLSPEERKEGFKKRNDKIGFQEFVENVLDKKQSATSSNQQKSLPGKGRGGALVKRQPGALVKLDNVSKAVPQEGSNILEEILKIVTSIRDTLIKQNEFDKKQSNQERRSGERRTRKSKEEKLEGNVFKGLAKAANKVLGPVKGLFGKIFDFIKTILIGRFLVKLIDWIGNSDNQRKLTAIGKFLEKTWPAILAAYLLFGNSLGRFITRLLFMTAKFIPRLAMTIGRLALAHPVAAAAILAAGGAAYMAVRNEQTRKEENKTDDAGTVTPKEFIESRKDNDKSNNQTPSGTQLMDEMTRQRGFGGMFNSGGIVPGSGPNRDTIPAMLTPGEFVMSRGAVQQYGADTLSSMNSMGGGTNRPMIRGGVTYANGGGHIHESGRKLRGDSETKNADIDPESGLPMNKPASAIASASVQPTESLIPGTDKDKVTKSWKPILDLIAKYEAVGGSYDSIYPSSTKPGLSKMTISEADSWQESTASSRGSAAAGRYQFMYIKKQAADAGIGPDKIFSPENQDKMAIALIEKKRKVTYDLMQKDPDEAMIRLGMEWAALPMPKSMQGHKRMVSAGQSYYAGDGKNKAGASVKEVRDAMKGIPPTVGRGSSSSIASNGSDGGVGSVSDSGGGGGETKPFDKSLLQTFDYNKVRQQLGVKTSSVSKSSRPSSSVAAYNQMQQQGQQQGQQQTEQSQTSDIPAFDAAAMSSPKKIKTLGITV